LLRCPLQPSLAASPSAIAPSLVVISHPSADAKPHRGIELSRRLGQSLGRHDERAFRLQVPLWAGNPGKELSRSLLNLAERDGTASYPQFTAMRGIPT
jgi:hypothetical protein